ncbi:ATP-dependent Clp protease proteolytic subunit [Bacillus sp. AG4(2022)]|uniref:ClpP family protease n=1 Tax=Bacillus sp. AG4(2022) TaxID=2962594 RepID=UPI002881D297|nr:ATP-dependent Clp protease proteolytic subunit [Bacillus sp. AG4(2022)]MDT0160286.1 ATP-dependent Clp protease proteolytic subunit [Bacillus sp. AG4(2022)]
MIDLEIKGMGVLEQIYIENAKERRLILNEEIDSQIYDTIAMQIKKFNKEDEGKAIEDRQPIELHINSVGGSVYDGFGLISVILASKTPVHGFCDGYVMSMGFAIYAACHVRFAGQFSNFMYHEVSTMSFGKNTEIEEVTKENRRLQKMYDKLITDRTELKQNKLNSVKKNKKDWFFGVEEALENGLVHKIL